jgi:hypothetical protein
MNDSGEGFAPRKKEAACRTMIPMADEAPEANCSCAGLTRRSGWGPEKNSIAAAVSTGGGGAAWGLKSVEAQDLHHICLFDFVFHSVPHRCSPSARAGWENLVLDGKGYSAPTDGRLSVGQLVPRGVARKRHVVAACLTLTWTHAGLAWPSFAVGIECLVGRDFVRGVSFLKSRIQVRLMSGGQDFFSSLQVWTPNNDSKRRQQQTTFQVSSACPTEGGKCSLMQECVAFVVSSSHCLSRVPEIIHQ